MVCSIEKHVINFCLACRKWCTFFKCNICLIVCSYGYISWNWNQFIRIVIKTWFNTFRFEFDRIPLLVFIFCCLIVYSIPFFVASLDSSLFESFKKFLVFLFKNILYFHFIWCLQNFVKIQKLFLLIFQW